MSDDKMQAAGSDADTARLLAKDLGVELVVTLGSLLAEETVPLAADDDALALDDDELGGSQGFVSSQPDAGALASALGYASRAAMLSSAAQTVIMSRISALVFLTMKMRA